MDVFTKIEHEKRNDHMLDALAEMFKQYLGPGGLFCLRAQMEKAKLFSFVNASDEQKLEFIEQVLEGVFAEFMSGAKISIIRSELLELVEVSLEAKTKFYSQSRGGMETKSRI